MRFVGMAAALIALGIIVILMSSQNNRIDSGLSMIGTGLVVAGVLMLYHLAKND
jgi:hypothetical protein